MGLDVVELVLEVEEQFGITVPRADWHQNMTVGELHEYVVKQYQARENLNREELLAPFVFGRIMDAAILIERVPTDIGPTEEIRTTVSPHHRQKLWRVMAAKTGWKFPPLNFGKSASRAILFLSVLIALPILGYFLHLHGVQGFMPGLLFAFLALFAITFGLNILLGQLLRYEPGDGERTWGDLAVSVLGLNYATISHLHQAWHTEEIWLAIQRLVSQQLGVPLEQVTPSARIVEDLGAD